MFYTGTVYHETEDGLKEKPTYVSGAAAGFKGITIMSDQFIQLVHPFPYCLRTYIENPNLKRFMWYVKKSDLALTDYYHKIKSGSTIANMSR